MRKGLSFPENWYEMDLGEVTQEGSTEVWRVPGGWVFEAYQPEHGSSVCFIPFNNEFQPSKLAGDPGGQS